MSQKMSSNAKFSPKTCPGKLKQVLPCDEVVISGIAGRFPESDNVVQLTENLMNGRDLVTEDERRWKLDCPDIPKRSGKINNLEKFDAAFFGIKDVIAHNTDPQGRILLEHAFEAVMDAGINPRSLNGSRTGVFIGNCHSETENDTLYGEELEASAFALEGTSSSMLASRISYYLGTIGPSIALDTACSSSHSAFENAYRAIHDGQCDAALVGGVNLTLQPIISKHLYTLGVLSIDGKCKTFNESANGYARSEAAVIVFLQKAKDARRVYATVVHSKMNCDGFKKEGISHPSGKMHARLLKEFYLECGVPPEKVSYIEPHAAGTSVGDNQEIFAIDQVLSHMRSNTDPLLTSSVKTSLGHTEAASGLVSIVKAIVMMENCMIPPHLHFNKPRKDLVPIIEGRIKVVTELTPWNSEYLGICGLGLGGVNVHILLKSHCKEKVNNGKPSDSLPRLVSVSGRTVDAVTTLLNDLESKPVDVEYIKLLHDLYSDDISGHLYRGYTVLPAHGVIESPMRAIELISGINRPIVFVYPGLGSEQLEIGGALLEIPIFAETIRKCDAVLKPLAIDIYHILTTKDSTVFNNLNTFLGIIATQMGLTDVLSAIGIRPNLIVGHSQGELSCGYADGCYTVEQVILIAYYRGLAFTENKYPKGAMYYVRLGYQQIKALCPSDIDIACRNSPNSMTISGPIDSVRQFAEKLQADGIYAVKVKCSNIPYHSRYIAPVKSYLLHRLKEIIPNPKPRSDKWLSTSVPTDKYNTPAACYASAEYVMTNILSPVLFDQILSGIPNNAVTIEISPKQIFQSILRRSLSSNVTNIPLLQRDQKDSVKVLLQAIGKMYIAGLQPRLSNLYPYVEYPVSRKTQMIAPLIKWQHKESWKVCYYNPNKKTTSDENVTKVPLKDSDIKLLAESIEDGQIQLTNWTNIGHPTLICESLGFNYNEVYPEVSLAFKNVKFLPAGSMKCDGIEIRGISPKFIANSNTNPTVVEEYKFVPFLDEAEVNSEVIKLFTHLTLENYVGTVVKTIELVDDDKILYKELLSPRILDAFAETPLFQGNIKVLSSKNTFEDRELPSSITVVDPSHFKEVDNAFFVVGHHLLKNNESNSFHTLVKYLDKGGFLLSRENCENIGNIEEFAESKGFHTIMKKKSGDEFFVLLKKREKVPENVIFIRVNNESFEWINEMRKALTEATEKKTAVDTRIYFIGEEFDNGLIGLINSLRREPGAKVVRGIQIQNPKAPKFSPNHQIYAKQIEKDLTMSVLRANDVWGSYRFSHLDSFKLSHGFITNCKDKNSTHFKCLPDRSYIVLGGLGGFGFELVNWLVTRGARNLVIVSRSGLKNDDQKKRLEIWKRGGVKVAIVTEKNTAVLKDCEEIIESANKLALVDGIFNLATILRDSLCANLNEEIFKDLFPAKAWAMKNLDILTRKLCPQLRYFVAFSSQTCGRGYIGQTNYGMSNAVMERICERRVAEGLPGLSIQWGPIGDVGIAARMQKTLGKKVFIINGTVLQPLNECLELLDHFLQQDRPVVSSLVVAVEKRQQTVDLKNTILNVMGISDSGGVNPFATFSEFGMDSLTTIEVKEMLEEELKITLTIKEVHSLNLNKIQVMRDEMNCKMHG